jgi:hypothetical protein
MFKQFSKRGFILSAVVVCAISVPITAAHAALVNYSFTGSIDGPAMFPCPAHFNSTMQRAGVVAYITAQLQVLP